MAFATASQWVTRLADAHHANRLQAELVRLARYPLPMIDAVGCPFEAKAAKRRSTMVASTSDHGTETAGSDPRRE